MESPALLVMVLAVAGGLGLVALLAPRLSVGGSRRDGTGGETDRWNTGGPDAFPYGVGAGEADNANTCDTGTPGDAGACDVSDFGGGDSGGDCGGDSGGGGDCGGGCD